MSRRLHRSVLAVALLAALSTVATAQQEAPFENPEEVPQPDPELVLAMAGVGFVLYLIAAAVLIHGLPDLARSASAYVRHEPIGTGLLGLVVLVGAFVAAVAVGLVPVVELLSPVILLALLVLMLAGVAVVDIAVGTALRGRFGSGPSDAGAATLWLSLVIGFLVVLVLSLVPLVNFLIVPAVYSLGVGALVQHWRGGEYDEGPGAGYDDAWDASDARSGDARSNDAWDDAGDDRDRSSRDGGDHW